jgi:hypothetical protein
MTQGESSTLPNVPAPEGQPFRTDQDHLKKLFVELEYAAWRFSVRSLQPSV